MEDSVKRVLIALLTISVAFVGSLVNATVASASPFGSVFSWVGSSSVNGLDGNYATFNFGYGNLLDNGNDHFILQGDGNAVVYNGATATWSTGTTGRTFNFQNDGNMVIRNSVGTALWNSGTGIRRENTCYRLIMQTDNNLVLYRSNYNPTTAACSGTPVVLFQSGT